MIYLKNTPECLSCSPTHAQGAGINLLPRAGAPRLGRLSPGCDCGSGGGRLRPPGLEGPRPAKLDSPDGASAGHVTETTFLPVLGAGHCPPPLCVLNLRSAPTALKAETLEPD